MIHPAYFQTHFRCSCQPAQWPDSLAVITAYATTGESWTAEENEAADSTLEAELKEMGLKPLRITGFSPETGHAEPGWAVEMGWEKACDLGHRYRQDAIYFVRGDTLFVSLCDGRRRLVEVGVFRERVGI